MREKLGSRSKCRFGYTPIDNFLLDVVLPLSNRKNPKFFPVLLFVVRRTVGWQKKADWISLTQFQRGTGASRDTVIDALRFWGAVGLVRRSERVGVRGSVSYEFVSDYNDGAVTSRMVRLVGSSDWSNGSASTNRMIPTSIVEPVDTQNKTIRKKPSKERKPSAFLSPRGKRNGEGRYASIPTL